MVTFQRNISQHCWEQHVACIWLPGCSEVLWHASRCWVLLAQIWEWSNFSCNICGCCMSCGRVVVLISFPEPTCLLVSTKTWSSCIINFQNYDDCLLNLSNCSCINSLRTQMYFRLSVDSAEINWLQRNQVTAGNMSKFVNTKICCCCSKLLASNLYSSFKSAYWRYHGRWIDGGWKLQFYADALKENPINLTFFESLIVI